MNPSSVLTSAGTGAASGSAAGPYGALIGAGIGAAGSIIGGMLGGNAAEKEREQARRMAEEAYNEAMLLGMPPDLSRELILQQFKSAGQLTPALEEAINLGPSSVAGLEENPEGRLAQRKALEILQQRGTSGLEAEDRAVLNKIRDENQRDAQGQREQILQNMQARGMGGSGAELASQLQATQGDINRQSMQGDEVAAQASQRALESMSRAGTMGGEIRSQDWNVANTKATAADEFKRFDTQNQINRQQRNVGSRNAAQQYNLDNSQDIGNRNTSQHNQELNRANNAQRDYWNDQKERTQMRVNAKLGQATQLNNQGDQKAQAWQTGGSAIGSMGGALANYWAQKPKSTKLSTDDDESWP